MANYHANDPFYLERLKALRLMREAETKHLVALEDQVEKSYRIIASIDKSLREVEAILKGDADPSVMSPELIQVLGKPMHMSTDEAPVVYAEHRVIE